MQKIGEKELVLVHRISKLTCVIKDDFVFLENFYLLIKSRPVSSLDFLSRSTIYKLNINIKYKM